MAVPRLINATRVAHRVAPRVMLEPAEKGHLRGHPPHRCSRGGGTGSLASICLDNRLQFVERVRDLVEQVRINRVQHRLVVGVGLHVGVVVRGAVDLAVVLGVLLVVRGRYAAVGVLVLVGVDVDELAGLLEVEVSFGVVLVGRVASTAVRVLVPVVDVLVDVIDPVVRIGRLLNLRRRLVLSRAITNGDVFIEQVPDVRRRSRVPGLGGHG
jgi:hypothetical protein